MAAENKKKSKKRFLPVLIIFGPALVLVLLSLGHCKNVYKELPVFDSIPQYEFIGANGDTINNSTQKGKVTIFTTLQSSCPQNCGMDLFSFNMKVYQPYRKNEDKFKNVDIISILTDSVGNPLSDNSEMLFTLKDMFQGYDSSIWNIALGNPEQVYDINSNGINLYTARQDSAFGGKLFLQTMLLVDREGRVRYVGRSDKEGYVRDFEQHVSLLLQEYKKHDKKK